MIKRAIWIFPLVGIMLVNIDISEVSAEETEEPKEFLLEEIRKDDQLSVIPQDTSQEIPQDTSQEIPQDTSQEIAQKTSQEIAQKTSQEIAQKTSQEIPQDTSQEIPQDTSQEIPQDTSQEIPQDTSQEIAQKTPQEIPQDTSQEIAQKTPQEIPQDTSQEIPQDTSQEIPQKTPQEIPQDTSQEIPQDTSQEIPQDTSQEIPQDTSQEIPQDTSQEIPQGTPQEIAQKTPQDTLTVGTPETIILDSISVTPPTTASSIGETIGRLEVVYNPGNALIPKWEYWWSTNPNIATVDAGTGMITTYRAGTTMIMVEVDTGQEAGALLAVSDSSTPAEELLESISVTPPTTASSIGETIDRLEVVYNPGNALIPKWEYWWSTNPDIATVDAGTGMITTYRAGTTMIMVEVDTGQEAGALLAVSDSSTPAEELLESISVTPPTTASSIGETIDRLEVVYNPGNALIPKWEYWWSTNPDIATVDAGTGMITTYRAGTTMIMVEVDTGQEAGALLAVSDSSTPAEEPLESISIDSSRTNLEVGETIDRLEVVYNPGNALKPKWEYWWSQNPDIAMVDPATGVITTIRDGRVTIMVEVDTGQVAAVKFIVGVIAENGPNSQIFLPLPTVYDDGSDWAGRTNQATHPSVIQFENNWNGYKYWMGFTPYPYGDDQKENPSVVASHDGINWVVPENILNPLVPIEIENAYNSDTHLVYNNTTNELELWYRQVQNATITETLYRIKTTDALNWTMPELMISASSNNFLQYISPSVIYEEGKYKMWFNRDWEVHYAESLDGKNWSEVVKINTAGQNVHTWHPSVQKFDDTYYLLNNDNDTNIGVRGAIRYSTSSDGINFTEEKFILSYRDDGESYDSAGVYRASMAVGEHGVYLYYGQISESYQWTIGMSIGANLDSLVGLDEETLAGFTRV
ncbi:Ig-like domain-containing protein [Carnobacterium funditum]|uniref:Ig-like domain-containing protein n=1 Tax=Carnobacterium funditum TaxID=2752 RepID=UPI00055438D0|nr:Ig-like domain-containing protein [Carnobacterium funditum]